MDDTSTTSTAGHTYTTRPATHADLPSYYAGDRVLLTYDPALAFTHHTVGQHLIAAVAAAAVLGLNVADHIVGVPRTQAELDDALATMQRSWDHNLDRYNASVVDPMACPQVLRSGVDGWAEAEGLPAIVWPIETTGGVA